MPRNGSGVYSKPAGTTAVAGTTIESAKFNSVIDDIASDLNAARPVSSGGTGATNATNARSNLGVLAATDTWTRTEADNRYPQIPSVAVTVASRTFLRALDTAREKVARLSERYQEGVYHWRTGNFTSRIAADPRGAVYIKADAVAANIGAWVREWDGGPISATLFGVRGLDEAGYDDRPYLQDAINFMEDLSGVRDGGGFGGTVQLPVGTLRLGSTIFLSNRVTLKGHNGRATVIKPFAGFSAARMIHSVNGAISQFGVRLEDMFFDTRGFNMTEVVLAEAWQETCGAYRVGMLTGPVGSAPGPGGDTRFGFHFANGYGGASYNTLVDCEVFHRSTRADAAAIRQSTVSLVGNHMLSIDGCSVTGDGDFRLPVAVQVLTDSLLLKTFHVEDCNFAVDFGGPGHLSIDGATGRDTVGVMVNFTGTFTGTYDLRGVAPFGATGNVIQFADARQPAVPAANGTVAHMWGQKTNFRAKRNTNTGGVTGNGANYIVLFDAEDFDHWNEMNAATGLYTAKRSGMVQFAAQVCVNAPVSATTCVLQLVTTGGTFVLWRGSLASFRDSSNNATIGGAISTWMNVGNTAQLVLVVLGVGADTVIVRANETFFSGAAI